MKPLPVETLPMPNEGTRAQHWRQVIMGLSIKQLSELTGYSVTAIRCFEANANTAGELFSDAAWTRYRNACAGATLLDQHFNWDEGAIIKENVNAHEQR
jgi:hypothetical protein